MGSLSWCFLQGNETEDKSIADDNSLKGVDYWEMVPKKWWLMFEACDLQSRSQTISEHCDIQAYHVCTVQHLEYFISQIRDDSVCWMAFTIFLEVWLYVISEYSKAENVGKVISLTSHHWWIAN